MLSTQSRRARFCVLFACSLGAFVMQCGGERSYRDVAADAGGGAESAGGEGEGGSAGSSITAAGAAGEPASAGGSGGESSVSDQPLAGGPSIEASAGTAGAIEPGIGAEGGAGAGGAATLGSAGESGAAGAPATPECVLNVHCSDERRPFCDTQAQRCVACLQASHCPAPSGDCLERQCVRGQCSQTPKARNSPCGSQTTSECDAPDTCDDAGKCLSNFKPVGTACDDDIYCNGQEHCNAAGQCAHSNDACPGAVCQETGKHCICDTTLVVLDYCGSLSDEAALREVASAAESSCRSRGCGDGNSSTTSNVVNQCLNYYCKP